MFNLFKKEKEEELATSFDAKRMHFGKEMLKGMREISENTLKFLNTNITFKILDADVNELDEIYIEKIKKYGKPVYIISHTSTEIRSLKVKENEVVITVLSIALNDKAYSVTIRSLFRSDDTSLFVFDDEAIKNCAILSDAFIREFTINSIMKSDYQIDIMKNFINNERIVNRHFEGYTSVYGDKEFTNENDISEFVSTNNEFISHNVYFNTIN